jgi:23S rRNA G2069 N7-methylase RlmK/C1962 C5-methylase RlmI
MSTMAKRGVCVLVIFMFTHSVASFIHRSTRQSVGSRRRIGAPNLHGRIHVDDYFKRFTTSLGVWVDATASTPDTQTNGALPRVLLKRNRVSKSFRDGSQLVFTGSIGAVPSSVALADLVQVEVPASDDPKNKNTQLVGWGVYNPDSMYRVRILQHALLNPHLKSKSAGSDSATLMKSILTSQMEKALTTRQALGLPSDTTDTYRLVNGEGDGLSGLAVDVIGNKVAVIMSSAAWCQVHQSTILESLQAVLPDHELIWKTTPSRLRQDGMTIANDEDEDEDDEEDVSPTIGTENGIKFQTFPHLKGQKTSVYCDQRENRQNLAQLCKGKRVLDLCSYHGGFSLNAAGQGATSVVGVDSSQEAIDTCWKNAELNGLQEKVDFIKSDISNYMKNCDSTFDVVVLDPPKLAPSVSGLAKASRKYQSLNRDALKLVDEKGGLFMTCTCSAAMTQKDGGKYFLQTVQQASLSAQREITLLRVSGAAPCHTQSPVSFPAGNYLTAALFHVHAKS